jgi:hypothetical protein
LIKLQEEIQVKMKTLAVITLLVIGCSFASAQTFGFESVGHGLYCNYEQLTNIGGSVYQGTDNLSACGLPINGTLAGVKNTLTAAGNPAGFQINGVQYADNIYDAESEAYTGAQWDVNSGLTCTSKKYNWIGFASVSGFIFGDNYGYLSCSIPGKKGAVGSKGLSTGSATQIARKK